VNGSFTGGANVPASTMSKSAPLVVSDVSGSAAANSTLAISKASFASSGFRRTSSPFAHCAT
jgi:hypothetical protein